MGGLRAAIDDGTPADVVERQAQVIGSLLTDAEAALSPDRASAASAFLGAFTILLREGLEALLIVEIGKAHSELQSLMRSSYAVFCLRNKNKKHAWAQQNNPQLPHHERN